MSVYELCFNAQDFGQNLNKMIGQGWRLSKMWSDKERVCDASDATMDTFNAELVTDAGTVCVLWYLIDDCGGSCRRVA